MCGEGVFLFAFPFFMFFKVVIFVGECVLDVCNERHKNFEKNILELKKDIEALEKRLNDVEHRLDKSYNNLQMRIIQLETKFDFISKTIVDLSDKFDDFVRKSKESDTSFEVFIKRLGLKLLEYAILTGIVMAVLYGFKLI